MVEHRGNEIVGAHLIDYKTDRVEPDDIDQRTEYYRPQLEGYERVLRRMTGLEAESILASLVILHADERREL